MRDYGRVSPKFWTGQTGKRIRSLGRDAQVVALYLMTNPHTNYLGLYYLPIPFMCHEIGIDEEGASKALASLYEAGFADYDPDSEHVWVYEMMRFQVADELKENDNRIKGINAAYMALPNNPFLKDFYDKYHESFHLDSVRNPDSKARAFKGASRALRSQEQEHEHEQDQEQGNDSPSGEGIPACPYDEIVEAYHRHLPTLPKVMKLTPARKKAVQARWREEPAHREEGFWDDFFRHAASQPFLLGDNPRKWTADFEWLMKQANFWKVVEGKYEEAA